MTTEGQEWPHTRFFPNPSNRHPTITGRGAIGSGISPFQVDIVSYWKLEEVSGSRLDEFGNVTLSEIGGTILRTPGIQGSGIALTKAQGRFLNNSTDSSKFNFTTNNFTIAIWCRMNGNRTLNQGLVSKFDLGTNREFTLFFLTSGGPAGTDKKFRFSTSSDGLDDHSVSMPSAGPEVQLNVNYFVVARRDHGANTLEIIVASGNGTWASRLTNSNTGPAGGLFAGNRPIDIGSVDFGANQVWEGWIDEPGLWKRKLSDNELEKLFNNGNGLTPPFP